jgi:acyl-CoA thioester hydrolase
MERIQIPAPDKFIFSTEIPIRIGDINRRNHLSHVSSIVIIEEARARFIRSIHTETELNRAGYILTGLSIEYLRQGHYGQTLRIDIAISDITDKGFDLYYKVADVKTGLELARAKSGSIRYNYRQKKVAQIPQDLKEKFSKGEGTSR